MSDLMQKTEDAIADFFGFAPDTGVKTCADCKGRLDLGGRLDPRVEYCCCDFDGETDVVDYERENPR